jgi:hypothetical protein
MYHFENFHGGRRHASHGVHDISKMAQHVQELNYYHKILEKRYLTGLIRSLIASTTGTCGDHMILPLSRNHNSKDNNHICMVQHCLAFLIRQLQLFGHLPLENLLHSQRSVRHHAILPFDASNILQRFHSNHKITYTVHTHLLIGWRQ